MKRQYIVRNILYKLSELMSEVIERVISISHSYFQFLLVDGICIVGRFLRITYQIILTVGLFGGI